VKNDEHIPGLPLVTGLEHTKEVAAMSWNAFPDQRIIIEDEIAEDDKVVLRWTMRATHKGELLGIPATGKQVTESGMTIYRLANAKIGELWFQSDDLSVMQQVGVIPVPGAA
jgi:steroid delta-isomerase-like uncharacterized protein